MVGAGSIVTKNIGDFELWVGNPAKHTGYVTVNGEFLNLELISKRTGRQYKWKDNILTESFFMTADDITLRLVEKSDSKFVLDLRTDAKLGQNISYTSPNIDDQINWMEEYKKREADEKEFYFIFEDLNHKPWGTIRLYNLTKDSFTIGSWICLPGNKNNIAIKAWHLGVEFGFEKLYYKTCLLDVRKKNLGVLYYLKLFNPILVKEDELNYFFRLEKNTFFNKKNKITNALNIKL